MYDEDLYNNDVITAGAKECYENYRADLSVSFQIHYVKWEDLPNRTKNLWRIVFFRACCAAGLESYIRNNKEDKQ